jgi:CDP-diacylglycerol--glycerol-3-phosphate 3-phosphatidyltransferase
MDRLYLLAPALLLAATFVVGLVVYTGLFLAGREPETRGVKHNQLFGPFLGRFAVWLLGPLERLLCGRVSPNVITALSLLMCALTGLAAGLAHLAGAVWLYALAGVLDLLDGRLARQQGRQTPAGAMFDSVSDRWGELFVFTGYAWLLHETAWLLAVMAACAGSMMVSYTRARAEGLGLSLTGGLMQRAERVVLVAGGTLIAAWYATDPDTATVATPIVGGTLLLCGVASTGTALHRWVLAQRELARRAEATATATAVAKVPSAKAPASAEPVIAPARASLTLQ